ncbi:MAG: hypothetical protein AAGI90_03065 [Chlamydiota bacterium]
MNILDEEQIFVHHVSSGRAVCRNLYCPEMWVVVERYLLQALTK